MADLAQQFGENTIDEPISETILRDLRLVGRRLLMVIIPTISSSEKRAELRDWDLWGPLFLCMSLAVMLSITAHDEASVVFSVIFVIVWVGAAVITVNGQLLGGKLSFFQSVCLLGYCIFPILLSAVACWAINSFVINDLAVVLRFVSVLVALLWSIWASSSFMTDAKFPEGRKLLALYPVLLFYLSLAWIVLIGFQRGSVPHAAVAEGSAPKNVTVGSAPEQEVLTSDLEVDQGSSAAASREITATPSAPLSKTSWSLLSSIPPIPISREEFPTRPRISRMRLGPSGIFPGWLFVAYIVPTWKYEG